MASGDFWRALDFGDVDEVDIAVAAMKDSSAFERTSSCSRFIVRPISLFRLMRRLNTRMRPLSSDQQYALWFVSANDVVQLGTTFMCEANGRSQFVANLSSTHQAAGANAQGLPQAIMVTIEREPISERPSGSIWLKAELTAEPQ